MRKLLLLLFIVFVFCGFGCKSTPEEPVEEAPPAEEAQAAPPEIDAATHYRQGNSYYAGNDLDEAISEYTQAITKDPSMADAYIGRGNAHSGKLEFEQALDDYKAGAGANIDYDHYAKGYGLYLAEDYSQAISEFDQAIAQGSNLLAAYNDRGLAYANMGSIDQAIMDYNEALKINSATPFPYNNLGNAYLVKGDYEKAIENFSRAIDIFPEMPFPYSGRGLAHYRQKLYENAVEDYTEAIAFSPRDSFIATLYSLRGNAYSAMGDREKADADYEEAANYGN